MQERELLGSSQEKKKKKYQLNRFCLLAKFIRGGKGLGGKWGKDGILTLDVEGGRGEWLAGLLRM